MIVIHVFYRSDLRKKTVIQCGHRIRWKKSQGKGWFRLSQLHHDLREFWMINGTAAVPPPGKEAGYLVPLHQSVVGYRLQFAPSAFLSRMAPVVGKYSSAHVSRHR